MPNWQPNWEDVRWNHGAARDATSALRHVADLLDRTAAERARVAQDATEQWCGRYREEFGEHLERMLTRARELARECRDASGAIAQASQRASEEQMRRERERERWRAEKEDEERENRRKQQGTS